MARWSKFGARVLATRVRAPPAALCHELSPPPRRLCISCFCTLLPPPMYMSFMGGEGFQVWGVNAPKPCCTWACAPFFSARLPLPMRRDAGEAVHLPTARSKPELHYSTRGKKLGSQIWSPRRVSCFAKKNIYFLAAKRKSALITSRQIRRTDF